MKKPNGYELLVLCALILIMAPIGAILTYLPKYYRLNSYGMLTQGTVISKEAENHHLIKAQYQIGYHKFKVLDTAEHFGKTYISVDIGEKVPVYYNPDDPQESCLGDPENQLNSSITGACFFSLAPLMLFVFQLIKNKFKPESGSNL